MPRPIGGGRRIIPIQTQSGVEFRTVHSIGRGMQWASCYTPQRPNFPPTFSGRGRHGQGTSWVAWLFIIPGGAAVILGFAPGIATASLGSIAVAFAAIVATLTATMIG